MMGDILLKIENLSVSFPYERKRLQVVRNVDITVRKGQIVGILGESGSGKTVSSTSILDLVKEDDGIIDGGKIVFKGQNLLELRESQMRTIRGKEISYIFQDAAASLNPYRRVGIQIEEVIKAHNLKISKTYISEVLRDVGLENHDLIYDMYPFQLSGGQCQRITIAMAIVCCPDLIIADEPTSAIDASLQKKVLTLFKEINEKYNMSMILITHDFDVAKFLCHRITIMYGGMVMESGGIDEILKTPLHPYTAELLACVDSLNRRESRLYALEGKPPSPYEFRNRCPFYERCKKKVEPCNHGLPPIKILEGEREIRCCNPLYDERM